MAALIQCKSRPSSPNDLAANMVVLKTSSHIHDLNGCAIPKYMCYSYTLAPTVVYWNITAVLMSALWKDWSAYRVLPSLTSTSCLSHLGNYHGNHDEEVNLILNKASQSQCR